MTGRVGVAISTTGDEHRLGFLETCVRHWCEVEGVDSLFVTVDGDQHALERAAEAVREHTESVYRVGQPAMPGFPLRDGRLGVAANKNTGLELLMNACVGATYPSIEHLFLCDDDTWPRNDDALRLHIDGPLKHSMVCWGSGRLAPDAVGEYATWTWPRGVLLYAHRSVVSQVGGMDERFGPGGHEHAEWSRRIHQAGLTPVSFGSPFQYAAKATGRGWATGAAAFWNCEDMPRPNEDTMAHRHRKRGQTSVRRVDGDWARIKQVMAERDGDTRFVPFRADTNGRAPATVAVNLMGQGADMVTPRAVEPGGIAGE